MTGGQTNVVSDDAARTITINRTFAAPRERVFAAFTQPEHLAHWFSPEGWTTETLAHELMPGGQWRYVMHGPDGMTSRGITTYREIDPPARFAYSDAFADEAGNPAAGMPLMEITVEFTEQGGRTAVVSTTRFASEDDLRKVLSFGVTEGIAQTWERLATYLAA